MAYYQGYGTQLLQSGVPNYGYQSSRYNQGYVYPSPNFIAPMSDEYLRQAATAPPLVTMDISGPPQLPVGEPRLIFVEKRTESSCGAFWACCDCCCSCIARICWTVVVLLSAGIIIGLLVYFIKYHKKHH